jgi:effector-binding domain-containing protein
MSYEVTIKEVPDVLVASIRTRVPMVTVGKEIEEAFARLAGFVMPVGFGTGMPGVVMYEKPTGGLDDEIELEVVMPIRENAEPPDGIRVRVLEGGCVASTLHRGPYDQVGPAYEVLGAWIPEHRHDIVGPPREFYLNDPREVGEDRALTEVQFPIR